MIHSLDVLVLLTSISSEMSILSYIAFSYYFYEHFSKKRFIIILIMIFIKNRPNKYYYILHV